MKPPKAYLIGGGIASLSAAVYLIQDGKMKGSDILVFEESEMVGGSLDARDLSSSEGYSMRGIRLFEEKAYNCLFDLMSRIPSLTAPGKTLRQEFVEFNVDNKTYSKARLLRGGQSINSRPLKLSLADRIKLALLVFKSESSMEDKTIRDYFTASFFESNFWYEFCTVFAFQPGHSLIEFKRYFKRFFQDFSNIDTLEGAECSPYNQYEFLVSPIIEWLKDQGVTFLMGVRVMDLGFAETEGSKTVTRIVCERSGVANFIEVSANDFVFATLGSLVASSSTGSMKESAPMNRNKDASWALWENVANGRPEFGKPGVFTGQIDKSTWTSFTITFRDPLFFQLVERFVHKDVNAYGGVSMIDSKWFMSIVLWYKPYYLNQPGGTNLIWGFGQTSEEKGDFIGKKMSECTGEEILTELIHHLGFSEHLDEILRTSVCIPCTTPYVTSLFLPRKKSDRPLVLPEGAKNFAFLGQYCEIKDEVVFTVEHSVRSAQIAVYTLLKINKKIPAIYHGMHHVGLLYKALKTLMR